MKFSSRHGVATAALLTIALSGWTAWRDMAPPSTDARQPRASVPTRDRASAPAPQAEGDIGREQLSEAVSDPFRVQSFLPPPPKVAPAPPPPPPPPVIAQKPVAPAFPYTFFGRMVDVNGKRQTYLSREDTLIPIKEHEILDNVFRIDAIGDGQITLTYLPLNEQSVIAAGSAEGH